MARNIIGLDIGSTDTRIVLWDGSSIRRMVRVPMPDNLVKDGAIVSYDAMADFLKQALREAKISGRDCAVILPARHAFLRRITMPVMTADQLVVNLPYEFRDYLTMEKDKYFYDYAVNDIIQGEEENQLDLIAAAVPKTVIGEYRDMMARAGLKLTAAVPVECAYTNILRRNTDKIPGECCFLNLTAASSRLDIFVGTRFETSRVMDNGIDAVVSAVSDAMSVDHTVARNYLDADFKDAQTIDASKQVYGTIALDIRKAVNFYGFSNRESNLEKMYYCGSGSSLQPLIETIAESVELDMSSIVELLPPISAEDSVDAAACICAIGAAIQSYDIKEKKGAEAPAKDVMNLAMREARNIQLKKLLPIAAGILVVCALFAKFGVADRYGFLNSRTAERNALQSKKDAIVAETADFNEVSAEYARYSVGWMTPAEQSMVKRTDILKLIDTELAPRCDIVSLSVADNSISVRMRGITLDQTSKLVETLNQREDISNVDFSVASSEYEGGETLICLLITVTNAEGGAQP